MLFVADRLLIIQSVVAYSRATPCTKSSSGRFQWTTTLRNCRHDKWRNIILNYECRFFKQEWSLVQTMSAISMIVWKKGVPSKDQATWSRALNCSKLDITVFQHIGPVWGYGVIAAQYRQCSSTLYCATFCHQIQISSMIGLVHTQQD